MQSHVHLLESAENVEEVWNNGKGVLKWSIGFNGITPRSNLEKWGSDFGRGSWESGYGCDDRKYEKICHCGNMRKRLIGKKAIVKKDDFQAMQYRMTDGS